MGTLADTLTLSKSLIREMRDDYDYVDGLVPDKKLTVDSTALREWLADDLSSDDEGNLLGNFFQWLGQLPPAFWYSLIALALLLCLLWVIRIIIKGKVRKKKAEIVDEEEEAPVDIYAVDRPQDELDRAVAAKDWDQAVRMTYILTLRHLHETGRIQWLPNKTPMDFVSAVGTAPFLRLTNAFLRVRFGRYPAAEQDWREAEAWRQATEKGGEA